VRVASTTGLTRTPSSRRALLPPSNAPDIAINMLANLTLAAKIDE
jgi:hypothetical protein